MTRRATKLAIEQLREVTQHPDPVAMTHEEILELADILEFENSRAINYAQTIKELSDDMLETDREHIRDLRQMVKVDRTAYLIFAAWSLIISVASIGVWRWIE